MSFLRPRWRAGFSAPAPDFNPGKWARNILYLFCLALLAPHALGATLYVAPNGSDTAPGTLARPFATVQKAQDAARPGDTVLLRGDVYKMTQAQIKRHRGLYADVTVLDKSGRPDAPITYAAYPGETPVFDFSAVKPAARVAFYVSGDYLRLQNFAVTGVQVTQQGHTQSECFEVHGSHGLYDRLRMHDGQAIGIYLLNGADNLFLNCDAYRNWDHISEGGRGGNTDGFGCHGKARDTGNVFRGCRAWFNSDDGFDCIHCAAPVVFDHCWAFDNGYSPTFQSLGDGNGFKAGGWAKVPVARLPHPIPRHTIRFCVAVHNKAAGFYANHQPGGSNWYNNTAYENGVNFNMLTRLADNVTDVPGFGHILKNNLGYKGRTEVTNLDFAKSEVTHNTFNGIPVTAADFQSLDESQLTRPRKTNGDLPAMTFLHLAPGSKLIDRGVPVGLPFQGKAPDLGAFESPPAKR